jgi:hypothetical protein
MLADLRGKDGRVVVAVDPYKFEDMRDIHRGDTVTVTAVSLGLSPIHTASALVEASVIQGPR